MPSIFVEQFVEQARAEESYNRGYHDEQMWDHYLAANRAGQRAIYAVLQAVEEEPEMGEAGDVDISRMSSPRGELTVVRTPFYRVDDGVSAATRGKLLQPENGRRRATEYELMLNPATVPYAVVDLEGAGPGRKAIEYPAFENMHRATGYDERIDKEVVAFLESVALGAENRFENRVAA